MRDAFAVIPDGNSNPAAVFSDLEEAISWALSRFGSDAFRIRGLVISPIEAEGLAAGGPQ